MSFSLLIAAALSAAPQTADPSPREYPSAEALADISELPLEEAAPPRCGVVFAIVDNAQKAGDARVDEWPVMAETNGREFFVRAMAKLMDDRKLTREQVDALVRREAQRLGSDEFRTVNQLMQPCLLMKQAAGL